MLHHDALQFKVFWVCTNCWKHIRANLHISIRYSHVTSIPISTTSSCNFLKIGFIPQATCSTPSSGLISNRSTSSLSSSKKSFAIDICILSLFHSISLIWVHAVCTCLGVTCRNAVCTFGVIDTGPFNIFVDHCGSTWGQSNVVIMEMVLMVV